MWKYFITASLLIFFQSAFCGEQDAVPAPLSSVEIDDNDNSVSTSTRDEKIHIDAIVKCGLDLSEPLIVKHIEGGLIGVDYSLDDIVVSNLSKCDVKSLKINLDSLDISMYLDCSHLSMFGKYNLTGMLIALFFEGAGETRVVADKYGLQLNGKLEKFVGEDDLFHIKVKSFTAESNYGGPVVYKLTNLFYGNEMLSTEAHNYINGNWKAVSEFGQAPLMSAVLRPFFKNINKCLKPVPVQNIQF